MSQLDGDTDLYFDGTGAGCCERFLQKIRQAAFTQNKSRDYGWMADFASLHFRGEAITWYEGLEGEIQSDWNLLRQAMIQKYGGERSASSIDTRTEPTSADPPVITSQLIALETQQIQIENWLRPVFRLNLRFPMSEAEWKDQAQRRTHAMRDQPGVVYWHWTEPGDGIPSNAIPTGSEFGITIFSIRVWKEESLILGKQTRGVIFWSDIGLRAWITWGGKEIICDGPYEVLVGDPAAVKWLSPRDAGQSRAVEGGFETSKEEALFIAQCSYMGSLVPGKVFAGAGQASFSWWGKEVQSDNFRVLAWT